MLGKGGGGEISNKTIVLGFFFKKKIIKNIDLFQFKKNKLTNKFK